MTALLGIKNLAVTGRLAPLSGAIQSGECLHLVGPNGAGKSTLLSCLAGIHPCLGDVNFAGQPLGAWSSGELAPQRAWLSQQQQPPFAMPVWHFLQLHQQTPEENGVMQSLARQLGLADKLTRPVNQLSGGEWQRVRLAAVILQIHPDCHRRGRLLLLDEPMASLDVAQQAAVDRLLQPLCDAGIAIVMSSHDLGHTVRRSDKAWLLKSGVLLAAGATSAVLSEHNLARAYDVNFRHIAVDGYNMFIPVE